MTIASKSPKRFPTIVIYFVQLLTTTLILIVIDKPDC